MTPSLFEVDAVDLAALARIAMRSIPREELFGDYLALLKSSDLHELGYTVVHWLKPSLPGSEVLEYMPTTGRNRENEGLPRVTAANYAEQVEIHNAIGARIVGPGQPFFRGIK